MMSPSPSESLAAKKGDPSGWLGFGRYDSEEFAVTEDEVAVCDFGGPLRGIKFICWARLERALACTVVEVGDGQYMVTSRSEAEPEWVDLRDPHIDRCHCRDFIYRGEALGTPCKHLLAACIADENRQVLAVVEQLRKRQAIAAAVQEPVTS